MMHSFAKFTVLILSAAALTSCSTMYPSTKQDMSTQLSVENVQTAPIKPGVTESGPIGGKFEMAMDENDRQKLSRALDSGIGKPTKWVNGATGAAYIVVPTKKVTVGSNKLCRQYSVTMTKQEQTQKMNATACIAEDGAWHPA